VHDAYRYSYCNIMYNCQAIAGFVVGPFAWRALCFVPRTRVCVWLRCPMDGFDSSCTWYIHAGCPSGKKMLQICTVELAYHGGKELWLNSIGCLSPFASSVAEKRKRGQRIGTDQSGKKHAFLAVGVTVKPSIARRGQSMRHLGDVKSSVVIHVCLCGLQVP
jgi:hypothetical protein